MSIGIGLGISQVLLGRVEAAFNPLNLSPIGLYDALESSSFSLTGNLIDQWNDLSGNGNHLTASGAVRPDYDSTNKWVLFDGVGERLDLSSFAGGNLSQPFSIVGAYKFVAKGSGFQTVIDGDPLQVGRGGWYEDTDNLKLTPSNEVVKNPLDTNWHINALLADGANVEFYEDGGSDLASTTTGTSTLNGLTVGASGGGGEPANVQVHFVMVTDDKLTSTELNDLGAYLNNRFSNTPTWTDI